MVLIETLIYIFIALPLPILIGHLMDSMDMTKNEKESPYMRHQKKFAKK